METPNVYNKNRPRRSLSLRTNSRPHFQDDDVVDSQELAAASPITTSASDSRLNLECSTPVNSNRKRNFFVEDGASPYIDSSMDMSGASPVPFTMSQELRRIGVDVVWQWDSPKRDEHIPMARKRRKSFTGARDTIRRPVCSLNGTGKATGFYKIREELLKAQNEDSVLLRLLQEDIPQCDEGTHKNAVCPESEGEEAPQTQPPNETLTRKLSDDYLNDSENDENLLIVSQETEKKVMEMEQRQTDLNIAGAASALRAKEKEMSLTNDSFDQYLMDIPFDELLNNVRSTLDQTVVNTSIGSASGTSSGVVVVGNKGTLNRTLSLPPDTEQTIRGASISYHRRSMARHESMPSTTTSGCTSKFSASNPILAVSSSSESLCSLTSSSTRTCTQDEIARKRQIAQQRLKCKQQQKQNRQLLTQEQPPKR